MTAANYAACLQFTLGEEGGFADNPDDPGGATNKGITLATYRDYTDDPNLTVADLLMISDVEVDAIYAVAYWNPVHGDALPAGIDLITWDMGVNAGIGTSGALLQRALGFTGRDVDGWIGPYTLAAVAKTNSATLIQQLNAKQDAYYRGLADFVTFGAGWLARLERRAGLALQMAGGGSNSVIS